MASLAHDLTRGFDILVIEDDILLANTIVHGWPVPADRLKVISDFRRSIQLTQSAELSYFDGVLIDIFLPDGDGLSILRTIRSQTDIPVVLMSGTGSSESRASAIEIGADGYIMKPFAIRELQAIIARLIKVRLTRQEPLTRSKFEIGDNLVCDLETGLLSRDGRNVPLTEAEVRIVTYLYENSGRICSKSALYKHAFYRSFDQSDKTLEVYVSRIRAKIADLNLKEAKRIQTVRGSGYRLSIVQ